MDLSFIEKSKIIIDIVTNKQNQKVGEDLFNRYRQFLKDIKDIERDNDYDEDEKAILKNLRVGALTGAGNANYAEFLLFKEIFPNDMLVINYWSFVRNRTIFSIDISLKTIKINSWRMIVSHLFYLGFIFLFLSIFTFLGWVLFEQLSAVTGELSLSSTIVAVIIGTIMCFLIITVFRLLFDHSCYSSLCNQVKAL